MKRPLRPCKEYGCKALVKRGYCELHSNIRKEKYRNNNKLYDQARGSRHVRGYDTRWTKFRLYYLRQHPICSKCANPATLIHHIVDLKKHGDKYEDSNLQPLCVACHNKIHKRHKLH